MLEERLEDAKKKQNRRDRVQEKNTDIGVTAGKKHS
jgi:hypothetical protein